MKRWRSTWWAYALLIYGGACAAFYSFQHLFFFQPKALDANHALTFPMRIRFTAQTLPFDSATKIDVVKFLPDSGVQPKGVVLFFHGNRYNVEHYSSYAPHFTSRGYECWMPDYPGYGRSTGEASIPLLQELALQLHKMAMKRYPADSILLYGKSLGSGVAAWLATRRDCRLLMLETPYASLADVASEYLPMLPVRWLMHHDLPVEDYLPNIAAPVVAWHGSADELIPLSKAARLRRYMKRRDIFYVLEGGRHNGLDSFSVYQRSLDSALLAR